MKAANGEQQCLATQKGSANKVASCSRIDVVYLSVAEMAVYDGLANVMQL